MLAIDAIKLLALKAVLEPDIDAFFRHVFRWYSKSFATPLTQVEDLPVEFVLQHYFEAHYEDMEQQQLLEERDELTETEEERQQRQQQKADDDAFYRAAVEEAAKEAARQTGQAAPQVADKLPTEFRPTPPKPVPDLPDISMTFDDNLSLEEFAESDPISAPAPAPKKT